MSNIEVMLTQTVVVATAALGMTIIIISGGIDLSVASNIALVTVIVAQVLKMHYAPSLAIAAGVGCAALAGLIIGGLVTSLRMAPFIVTLGSLTALRGAAKELSEGNTVDPRIPALWLDDVLIVPFRKVPAWLPAFKPLRVLWELPPGFWVAAILAVGVAVLCGTPSSGDTSTPSAPTNRQPGSVA